LQSGAHDPAAPRPGFKHHSRFAPPRPRLLLTHQNHPRRKPQIPKLLKPPDINTDELRRRINDPEVGPSPAGGAFAGAAAAPCPGATACLPGPSNRRCPLSAGARAPAAREQVKRQRQALGRAFRQFGLDQFRMSRYILQHRQS
jgi:hypothetical protein